MVKAKAAILLLLALAWALPAQAEVKVNIDRNPVQVNESFQLIFSLDHSPDRDPDFSMLQQHFMILGNNRSSSISIINGQYQRSVKWTLQLMPKQVGEFMIPAIRFGRERSKPFQITVKEASLSTLPHDELVLELLADRNESYVQAQVILTLRLLSAKNISDLEFGKLRVENGDAVIEALGRARQYQTRIADRRYQVLEKRYALFPQQSGRLEVAPVMAEVRLMSGSSFDPFQMGGKIKRLRSQPLALEILPIPPEFQGSYWLPANRFELREQWQGDLDDLVAGEPVTRSLTLIADGLTAAQLPELPLSAIDGIKQYPDQPTLENERYKGGIRGQRVQKVALIPGSAGSYRVPEINVPWWNLETGKMEIATIPGREILVNPAAPEANAEPAQAPPAAPVPAPAAAAPVAEGNDFWLWLSLLLACGWAASAGYWWWRARAPRRHNAATPVSTSLRQAQRQLREACAADDAAAARGALLAWGQALLAPEAVPNLNRLCARLGPELSAEVERLNQCLYGRQPSGWQGAGLAELCRRLEQRAAPRAAQQSDLMPLNPAA